jgi:predicted nucleic acid-binding protein
MAGVAPVINIALKVIELRLQYKTKLPDAIIAATAMFYNLTVITRNILDFNKIEGIKILDLYSL